MATKPNNVPSWATQDQVDPVSGQTNKIEPPQSYEDGGWSRREIPPRQYWNWMLWKIGQWIAWLAAGTPNATASTVVERDSGGRTKVADPVDDGDAVNKGYVDTPALRQVVELGGDFDAGASVMVTRSGVDVSVRREGAMTHPSASYAESDAVFPDWVFEEDSTKTPRGASKVTEYDALNNYVVELTMSPITKTLQVRYSEADGGSTTNRTNAGTDLSITYSVATDVTA